MATAQDSGSGGLASAVASARDFVRERLRDADSAMAPSDLAEEYGCSSAHMSNICSELNQSGEIERVETGQYVDGAGSATESDAPESEQSGAESGGSPGGKTEAEGEHLEEPREESNGAGDGPSADGGARSADLDTTGAGSGDGGGPGAVEAGATASAGLVAAFWDDLSDTQQALAVVLVVVLLWLYLGGGSGSSNAGAVDVEQDDEDTEAAGGLIA